MQKETVEVKVLFHEAGIHAGCILCQEIIASGLYAVEVLVGDHRYLVGEDPPINHCGEEKKVPRLFDSEEEAQSAARQVIEVLNQERDTSSLRLFEAAPFVSVATH